MLKICKYNTTQLYSFLLKPGRIKSFLSPNGKTGQKKRQTQHYKPYVRFYKTFCVPYQAYCLGSDSKMFSFSFFWSDSKIQLLINHERQHNSVCIPFIQPGPEKLYSYRKKEFGGKHWLNFIIFGLRVLGNQSQLFVNFFMQVKSNHTLDQK